MASVKFYLTRANAKEKTSVFFLCNYGAYEMVEGKKKYLPLKYYTDETIHPEFWNKEKGRAKETKNFPQYPEFNIRLKKIEDGVMNVVRRLKNDGIVLNNTVLRTELDRIFKATKNLTAGANELPADAVEMLPFVKHFIETAQVARQTIYAYQETYRNLEEYQRQKKTILTFQMIDMDFYNEFISMLKAKNYAPNSIGCRIKLLKKFINEAADRGLPVRDDYKKKGFVTVKEETAAVYLNETELMQMYKLDLSETPKLAIVRDLFLIGCYTGLRFSDLKKLSVDNFNADNTISVKTKKTGTDVVIPVHPMVRAILEKYGNKLPKTPYNQLFNDRIGEVAKLAKINDIVCREFTKGNERVKQSVEKHELVTSHTARRSFATNAYLRDVPALSIMKITGHKTEKSFMGYIKMSQKDNALKLQTHSFFTTAVS